MRKKSNRQVVRGIKVLLVKLVTLFYECYIFWFSSIASPPIVKIDEREIDLHNQICQQSVDVALVEIR